MKILKFIPIYSGVAIAIMVFLNTILAKSIGDLYSTLIIHFIGLIIAIILGIFTKQKVKFDKSIPTWIYLGGALGIFVVLFNTISIQKIGVSLVLTLGIAGQIITSIVLEHIGFLGTVKNKFTVSKVPGIVFIIIGSILIFI